MAILIATVLIVLSAAVLAFPFLNRRVPAADDGPGDDAGSTDHEMEALLEDMRVLQLDYQSGNIPNGLYQEQLRAYRLQAASHLRQRAEAQLTSADLDLEQEILMARLSSQDQVRPGSAEPAEPEDPEPNMREDSER